METINYKLEQFEGPIDLLLTLITNNKLNIDDIPISLLCDQYMDYINNAIENRIEVASEFIVMASELMLIKSRMLLPRNPETMEDPRKALIDSVVEYSKAKLAAAELKNLFTEYGGRMIKEQDDISVDRKYVADHSIDLLTKALIHAMTEARVTSEFAKTGFVEIVAKPRVPIRTVVNILITELKSHGSIYLESYFASCDGGYSEMIARFLGFLELIRSHIIVVTDDLPEDGVTDISTHAVVLLSNEASEERIAEIDALYEASEGNHADDSITDDIINSSIK